MKSKRELCIRFTRRAPESFRPLLQLLDVSGVNGHSILASWKKHKNRTEFIKNLRGSSIAFTEYDSLGGHILASNYLKENFKLSHGDFKKVLFTGSYTKSISLLSSHQVDYVASLNTVLKVMENRLGKEFSKIEIQNIINEAENKNCKIIMTEKDYFKINRFKLEKINYLKVSLEIKDKEKLFETINSFI